MTSETLERELGTVSALPAVSDEARLKRSEFSQLKNGDRLSRSEFEWRYIQAPETFRAELVEGIVYAHSQVPNNLHGVPHAHLLWWLGMYEVKTFGIRVSGSTTVRLDWDNEPQPDAMLRIPPEYGGQTRNEDGYVALAPEWVGEIAGTSASYDLHGKLEAYRRNGVREYFVWRTEDQAIDWLVHRGGRFEPLRPTADGILRSEVFPGLWLDSVAMLEGNLNKVIDVLNVGLATAEHATFAAELQARRVAR